MMMHSTLFAVDDLRMDREIDVVRVVFDVHNDALRVQADTFDVRFVWREYLRNTRIDTATKKVSLDKLRV